MTHPIGDYGFIGDTRSGALIAPDGTIDWWCVPRFDRAPVFGRLVGGDEAGSFALGPVAPAARHVAYRDHTTTLVTTWAVDGAELTLEDTLVAEVGGRLLPPTVLVRRLSVRGSAVPCRISVAPRFGYGRQPARRTARRSGGLILESGDLVLAVTTDLGVPIEPGSEVEWELRPDRPVTVVMTASDNGPAIIVPPDVGRAAATRDERSWRGWCPDLPDDLPHVASVRRSLIVLRLLTYAPSGAPVAAPTTSLPEVLGGDRNWDYRYSWPRDASMGLAAFLAADKHEEALAFIAWLLHANRIARPRLPVLFTLDGRPGTPERELDGWPGYEHSRPVRVGNGASQQEQLDGYGWVLDAAWRLEQAGHRLNGETWRAMASLADYVVEHWQQPDAGIWEHREAPSHHVHSKLMAWRALECALHLAVGRRLLPARRHRWEAARDGVAHAIRTRAYDAGLGAYVARFDSADLDAALLLLPMLEFEPDRAKVRGTIDAIRSRLGAGGALLYRYLSDERPAEGAFLACSFWLVQALAATGQTDEANAVFDELIGLGGPLGLYGEELDPRTHAHLGNYPQALTHAALVQAAFALRRASGGAGAA